MAFSPPVATPIDTTIGAAYSFSRCNARFKQFPGFDAHYCPSVFTSIIQIQNMNCMLHVFLLRTPFKIFDMAIRLVPIDVIYEWFPLDFWQKRFCDLAVYVKVFYYSAFRNTYF